MSDEILHRVALALACEPGDATVGAELARSGAAEALRTRLEDPAPQRRPDLVAARAELERAAALGVRLVVPDTPAWPTQLDDLGDRRPIVLWVMGSGDLRLGALRSVAVVGARAASAYGVRVAATLGSGLAAAGWTVVSGGAYGIDAAAHRGALAAGGETFAVLASGVDVPYPKGNDSLFDRLSEHGLLISEVSLGQGPRRYRFLVRNRVIAALSRGTVVVEAALRSGALGTLGEACRLDRFTMSVPGPVDSFVSAGSNRAIRDGAMLVTSAAEVIEQVGDLGVDLAPVPSPPERPRDRLSRLARDVLEHFPAHDSIPHQELLAAAGLSPAVAPIVLTELTSAGLVRRDESGWALTPRGRA